MRLLLLLFAVLTAPFASAQALLLRPSEVGVGWSVSPAIGDVDYGSMGPTVAAGRLDFSYAWATGLPDGTRVFAASLGVDAVQPERTREQPLGLHVGFGVGKVEIEDHDGFSATTLTGLLSPYADVFGPDAAFRLVPTLHTGLTHASSRGDSELAFVFGASVLAGPALGPVRPYVQPSLMRVANTGELQFSLTFGAALAIGIGPAPATAPAAAP